MLATDLARQFEEIADILELNNDSVFKVRAYRKAAQVIPELPADDLATKTATQLKQLPGIGPAIAEKIVEYRETGRIEHLEKLKAVLPPGLYNLLKVPNLGPRGVMQMRTELGVQNEADLLQAIDSGRLAELHGFGPKKAAKIKKSLRYADAADERIPWEQADVIAAQIIEYLKQTVAVLNISPAGSVRRRKPLVRDIDILVSSYQPKKVILRFLKYPKALTVQAQGETKASILTQTNRQIDLRVVEPESFGSALQYFTGSRDHNIALRRIAQKKGLKLSEYGVFRGDEKIAGQTEEEVYAALGQPWIPPEKRLGQSEFKSVDT